MGKTTGKSTRKTAGRPTGKTAGRTTGRPAGKAAGSSGKSGQNTGKTTAKRSSQSTAHRRKKNNIYRKIRIGVIAVTAVLVVLILAFVQSRRAVTVSNPDLIQVYVDGENYTSVSAEKAEKLLLQKYAWDMSVSYGEQSAEIPNPFEENIHKAVTSAFQEAEQEQKRLDARSFWEKLFGGKNEPVVVIQRDLELPGLEQLAQEVADEVSVQWRIPAQDCHITGYDAEADIFLFSEAEDGKEIDTEKLTADILEAYRNKEYGAVLTAQSKLVAPQITRDSYCVMGSYTTTTTANKDRNTNVELAAKAVNGQIVEPGEQFSFNTVVGKRTEEKGYKPAPAYANGETVQEFGGGVCQVSSTLYNAVIAAGLKTDERTGHSYEPTYVTPGQDATVSYSKPDFVFTNTSSQAVGIRTQFHNRTMYVEIFGVPVLEEGVKRYMESKQVTLLDPPAPSYVEDPAIPFGEEAVAKNPTNGSIWTTDIVMEKDGEVIERTYLHQTRYKGHAAVIHRNTQGAAPVEVE